MIFTIFLFIGFTTKVKATTDVDSFLSELKSWVNDPTGIELDTSKENTIILNKNIKLGNRLNITDGKIVLDLNGHIIDAEDISIIFTINGENADFTITDSSENKTGAIKTTGSEMIFMESGKLTIDEGTYSADYNIIRARGGNIVINGGSFKSDNGQNEYEERYYDTTVSSVKVVKETENKNIAIISIGIISIIGLLYINKKYTK